MSTWREHRQNHLCSSCALVTCAHVHLNMNLKLDLHDIFSEGHKLDQAIEEIMEEAIAKRAKTVEIIPGKGSGQLKKFVLRTLEKNYKGKYHRIEKDDKNWGRIFVHFRWV